MKQRRTKNFLTVDNFIYLKLFCLTPVLSTFDSSLYHLGRYSNHSNCCILFAHSIQKSQSLTNEYSTDIRFQNKLISWCKPLYIFISCSLISTAVVKCFSAGTANKESSVGKNILKSFNQHYQHWIFSLLFKVIT